MTRYKRTGGDLETGGDAGAVSSLVIPGYESLEIIAHSDRAVVLRAWQPTFGRHVAIKVVLDRQTAELEEMIRRVGALTGHPNVVTVHEIGFDKLGRPFIAMDFMDGGSLADRLRWAEPLDAYQISHLAISVAGVVAHAQQAGVSGLAVAAEHVLLSRFGEPKLVVACHRASPGDLPSLRSTLRVMLNGAAATDDDATVGRSALTNSLSLAARDGALDATGFVVRLQVAQAEAGYPVTQPPPVGFAAAPIVHLPEEVLSNAVTVAPARRASRRLRLGAAAGLAVLGLATLATLAMTALPDRNTPTTTRPEPSRGTSAAVTPRPVDPPFYTADFAPGSGWPYPVGNGVEVAYVDDRYQIRLAPGTGIKAAPVILLSAERRLSVSMHARLVGAPTARIGLVCGEERPGFASLAADFYGNGRWEIRANERVVASGSAQFDEARGLRGFTLRLDCHADRSPTLVALFLDDVLIGRAESLDPYAIRNLGVSAFTSADAAAEITITKMDVRRLA